MYIHENVPSQLDMHIEESHLPVLREWVLIQRDDSAPELLPWHQLHSKQASGSFETARTQKT